MTAPNPSSSATEIALRLLQASSCFRPGAACGSLPCACAQSLVDALSPQAQAGDTDFDEYPYDDERFNRGVQHVVDLLANTIAAPDTWRSGDGSEDYDEDLAETLRNILAARGLYDKDTGEFGGVAQGQSDREDDPYITDLKFAIEQNIKAARKYKARLDFMEVKYGAIDWDGTASPPAAVPANLATGEFENQETDPAYFKPDRWTVDQFWQFAEGLTGAHVRDQLRDAMAERGLSITSTDRAYPDPADRWEGWPEPPMRGGK